MRDVDTAILAALNAVLANVNDGAVDMDDAGQVVLCPVPYVVYWSDLGRPEARRMNGRASVTAVGFQVTYVGESREQAKWAGEKQRAALEGLAIPVPGRRSWLVTLDDTQRVIPDGSAWLPGTPARRPFYGVDQYTLAVTR